MYQIGDKIVYPMHGAGVIEAIEEKKILKEKQAFYIMKMPIGDMMVMIPIKNCVEIGIRDIISKEQALEIIQMFEVQVCDITDNWNKRYRENMIKIKTGDILEVLDVVKTLLLMDRTKGLSTGERKMLSNAKQILISELVLAQATSHDEAEELLEQAICRQIDKNA